jgi:hypothetical protein
MVVKLSKTLFLELQIRCKVMTEFVLVCDLETIFEGNYKNGIKDVLWATL